MTPGALAIRDAAYDLLKGSDLFEAVIKNRTDLEPDDQLPALVILTVREQMTPDGDLNAGPPSFVNELTLAFLIKVFADAQDEIELLLNERSALVTGTLLTDPAFVNESEGISGIIEARSYPRDGETYYGDARIEISFQFRTTFEPVIPDDFRRVRETMKPKGSGPGTPTLTQDYDVETGEPWTS